MTILQLLDGIEYELLKGSLDLDVTGLCFDNRKVRKGDLFVCIKGAYFDTHDVVCDIAGNGASAVVVDTLWADEHKELIDTVSCTVISVKDTRAAKAGVSAAWNGHPSEKMTVIGITGSKGKTTTSHMIWSMLGAAGLKAGLVSTTGGYIGEHHIQFGTSTPDSDRMQEFLARMVDEGCEYAVIECSSQGLKLHRTDFIDFDYGIFLNIEKGDHISPTEHKDFDEYLDCKRKLLRSSRTCIVNGDDGHIEDMLNGVTGKVIKYGENVDNCLDYIISNVKESNIGSRPCVSFRLTDQRNTFAQNNSSEETNERSKEDNSEQYTIGLPGLFNVGNAAAACIAAAECGIPEKASKEALMDIKVPGRLDMVYQSDELSVCVDYAHNGLSTRNLLRALRSYRPKRIVCVFGCGGDRDKNRRPEMGEASGNLADLSIITTEHNRFEEFQDILKDIMAGMKKTSGKYEIIEDRKEAIRHAIIDSEPGDLITILGIGNDGFQHDHGKNIPHDDISFSKQCVEEWLAEK